MRQSGSSGTKARELRNYTAEVSAPPRVATSGYRLPRLVTYTRQETTGACDKHPSAGLHPRCLAHTGQPVTTLETSVGTGRP